MIFVLVPGNEPDEPQPVTELPMKETARTKKEVLASIDAITLQIAEEMKLMGEFGLQASNALGALRRAYAESCAEMRYLQSGEVAND